MCGIVGRAGMLKSDDETIFKVLLLLDYFRGQDATGIVSVSKKEKVDILKLADDPIMLMKHQDFDNLVVGVSDAIWIGHNRSATVGSTTRENAHPFRHGHIVGVHNGTLDKSSYNELALRLEHNYGTDSETIFAHIALYGIDDTVARLQGAWALVWYNEEEHTLNMLRNDKRPLWTCQVERDGTKLMTWASEFKMIQAARHMVDAGDGKIVADEGGYGYFPLPEDTLHSWGFDEILAGNFEATIRPLEGKVSPVVSHVMGYYDGSSFTSTTGGSSPNKDKTGGFPVVKDNYEVTEVSISDEGLVLGCLEQSEWDDMSRFGCAACGKDVEPDERGLIVYVNEGTVLCGTCSGEAETVISNSFGISIFDRIMG